MVIDKKTTFTKPLCASCSRDCESLQGAQLPFRCINAAIYRGEVADTWSDCQGPNCNSIETGRRFVRNWPASQPFPTCLSQSARRPSDRCHSQQHGLRLPLDKHALLPQPIKFSTHHIQSQLTSLLWVYLAFDGPERNRTRLRALIAAAFDCAPACTPRSRDQACKHPS